MKRNEPETPMRLYLTLDKDDVDQGGALVPVLSVVPPSEDSVVVGSIPLEEGRSPGWMVLAQHMREAHAVDERRMDNFTTIGFAIEDLASEACKLMYGHMLQQQK